MTFIKEVKDEFAILGQQLASHLKLKGIVITNLLKNLPKVLGQSAVVSGKQHVFLKPGSELLEIPSGRLGRKHPDVVYVRCVLIQKSALSKDTCKTIVEGILHHYI